MIRGRLLVVGLAGLMLALAGVEFSSRDQRGAPPAAIKPPSASVGVATSVTRPQPESSSARWQRLLTAPGTIARDAELAEILGELIDTDLSLAADLFQRLSENERLRLGAVVLWDVAADPQRATARAIALCRIDGAAALQHGDALLSVWLRRQDYAAAVDFVLAANAALAAGEEPAKWMRRLFAEWTTRHPLNATRGAAALNDESLRAEALGSVVNAWLQTDPAAATAFIAHLPPGPARASVLASIALR